VPYERDEPHVEPDELREYARALKADARDLENVTTGMRSSMRAMDFEGPAADRFHEKTRPRIKELRELGDRLTEVVRLLLDTADEIERERRRRYGDGNELVAETTGFWTTR
jgi:uncharacterized protein YukE